MALYPCSFDNRRYRGAATHVYPAIVRGRDSDREHLRLCPTDFDAYRDSVTARLELVDYDGEGPHQDQLPICSWCGGLPSDPSTVFVTMYPPSDDQVDFYGVVCRDCHDEAAADLLIHPKPRAVGPAAPPANARGRKAP